MTGTELKRDTSMEAFANEAFTDFSSEINANLMKEAISARRTCLGAHYDLWIDGENIAGDRVINSLNPANIREVIGTVSSASAENARNAIAAADKAFDSWSHTTWEERAALLFRTADRLRERKHEFSAMMVLEVGKSWAEADADTAEAIDFLDFYARLALELANPRKLTPLPSEDNRLMYLPLGVGVVIPPWNFPLAILVGMTTAAVVTGNTVVLKPSSDSPVVAAEFIKLFRECGCPSGVVNFCPGSGAEIGDLLVDHPRTRFISFTGSKEVGLRIVERAARTHEGQIWIKRVVAEMGGKDAILVDDPCDVDVAVAGTVAAAFGFSGQKCSACSRVIVHENIYDEFVEKLTVKAQEVTYGNMENNEFYMGPVSSANAHKSILNYIEIGQSEGRLLMGGNAGPDVGWFVEPTIIADVDSNGVIAQEEIFGPVLAVVKCSDFEDGLAKVNSTDYGLTGAIYSDNEEHLARAERDFHVGNFYVNRKCTGALVGAQPFGGFNMSGTDSKAGGYDYLLLFTQAKMISAARR